MAAGAEALSEAEVSRACDALAIWRNDPEATIACPRCGHRGLRLIDCSARPYAEWFALTCGQCGLDATLNIPMAPPPI